jgi:iron complex transport system ATP-binding protein
MRSALHEAPLIFTRDLSLRIGNTNVCHALNWQVNPGERWAILGKNGVGKSTLLTTLAGLRRPQHGELNLCGVQIGVSPAPTFSRQAQQQIAKRRGYLAQHHSDPFSSTVLETALIGRHPHLGRWDWESARDRDIAYAALNEVDLAGLADRDVQTLSGGERQRLAIAQLFTQQPQLFLLDEPLTHLDLSHQVAVMELFKQKTQANDCPTHTGLSGLVAVLHDPGFAVRYCDHALLLFGNGEWLAGASGDIITAKNLTRLYGHPLREIVSDNDSWFIPC